MAPNRDALAQITALRDVLDPRLRFRIGGVGGHTPRARYAAMVYADGRSILKPRTMRALHYLDLYHATLPPATFLEHEN